VASLSVTAKEVFFLDKSSPKPNNQEAIDVFLIYRKFGNPEFLRRLNRFEEKR